MGFDDVNEAILTGGGGYAKLQQRGAVVEGVLVDVSTREMIYDGLVVKSKKTGQPRKEWVFVLDTNDGRIKVSARENIQIATRSALDKSGSTKLEAGAKIRFEVVKDSVRGEVSAEVVVTYTPPKFQVFADDDAPPF